MKLLLDIGNTRLKWVGLHAGGFICEGAIAHDGAPAQVIASLPDTTVDAVWIANVTGPAHEAEISAAIEARFACAPRFARSQAQWHGLRSAYAEPERLGIDRWLALVAAWQQLGGAAVIVSAGTALTVDVLASDGRHRGGIIAAGLSAQLHSVLAHTRFDTRAFDRAASQLRLGTDTESCVYQGALFACCGAIERLAQLAEANAACLVTGGDSAHLLHALGPRWQHRPQLVLEGLRAVCEAPAEATD